MTNDYAGLPTPEEMKARLDALNTIDQEIATLTGRSGAEISAQYDLLGAEHNVIIVVGGNSSKRAGISSLKLDSFTQGVFLHLFRAQKNWDATLTPENIAEILNLSDSDAVTRRQLEEELKGIGSKQAHLEQAINGSGLTQEEYTKFVRDEQINRNDPVQHLAKLKKSFPNNGLLQGFQFPTSLVDVALNGLESGGYIQRVSSTEGDVAYQVTPAFVEKLVTRLEKMEIDAAQQFEEANTAQAAPPASEAAHAVTDIGHHDANPTVPGWVKGVGLVAGGVLALASLRGCPTDAHGEPLPADHADKPVHVVEAKGSMYEPPIQDTSVLRAPGKPGR